MAILVLSFLPLAAAAQDTPIDQGSFMFKGSFYLMSQSGEAYEKDDKDLITIGVTPEIGYFLANGFVLGVAYDYARTEQGDNTRSTNGIGPIIGYYFMLDDLRLDVRGSFYPYIQGLMFFSTENEKNSTNGSVVETKYDFLKFGGKVGLNYMITEDIAIDLAVRYTVDKKTQKKPEILAGEDDTFSGDTIWIGMGITAYLYY
jgi:outer membrane protein W